MTYLMMIDAEMCGMSLSGKVFASCIAARNRSAGANDPRVGSNGLMSLELAENGNNCSIECRRCRSGRARRLDSNRCAHSPKSSMRWIGYPR